MNIARRELNEVIMINERNFNVKYIISQVKSDTNIIYVIDNQNFLLGIVTIGDLRKILSGEIPYEINKKFNFIEYNSFKNAESPEEFFKNERDLEIPVLSEGKLVFELYRKDKKRRSSVVDFERIKTSIFKLRLLEMLGSKIHIKELNERTLGIYRLLELNKDIEILVSSNKIDIIKPKKYGNQICDTVIYDTTVKFEFTEFGTRHIDIEQIYCNFLSQSIFNYMSKNDVTYLYFETPKYYKISNNQKENLRSGSFDEFANNESELESVYGDNQNKEYWTSKEYEKVSLIRQNECLRLTDFNGTHYKVINGIRETTNSPKHYKNTIYVYGSCIARGFGVSNNSTIESYLQNLVNTYYKNQYRLVNQGIGGKVDDIEDFTKMMFQEYKKGDIVIHIGGNSWNDMETDERPLVYTCSEALNNFDSSIPIFIDKVVHLNHNGNKCVAEFIFRKLESNKILQFNSDNHIIAPYKESLSKYDNISLESFKEQLKQFRVQDFLSKRIGAIVMNCNPFTNGHLYLIEQSRKQVDFLYIFVVEENKSYFSFEDRYRLVKDNCSHMDNVMVLPSGRFIISTETFPDYFIKNELQEVQIDPSLDVELFGKEIAPVLNIKTRFLGTEPIDKVTAQYNDSLKQLLRNFNVEVVEIQRICVDDTIVSASFVRKEIQNRNFEKLKEFVPSYTYQYILGRYHK